MSADVVRRFQWELENGAGSRAVVISWIGTENVCVFYCMPMGDDPIEDWMDEEQAAIHTSTVFELPPYHRTPLEVDGFVRSHAARWLAEYEADEAVELACSCSVDEDACPICTGPTCPGCGRRSGHDDGCSD